jgi:hypothetical protein
LFRNPLKPRSMVSAETTYFTLALPTPVSPPI